jgi:MFS family permease
LQDKSIPPVASRHYVLLGLLTLLNVLNFVDRQLLGSFAAFIVPDLELTNAQFGWLTGLAFLFFYSTVGLFMGALADLVHRPRLIAVGLAVWSGLTAASGAARSFVSLAIPRAFIGIGESTLTPTSMSLLSDRFPLSRLGFAAGVYYMGVPIGVGVSLLIAGYLGPAIGWRNCFYLLGAVGLALSLVVLFVRETPRGHQVGLAVGHRRQSLGDIARTLGAALVRSPALGLTMLGGIFLHMVLGAAQFDQLWFTAELGYERSFSARAVGWVGMAGGICGNLVGGLGGDWWQKRFGQGRPMFLFWLGIALAPIALAYRLQSAGTLFLWVGVFVGYFQMGSFYGPTMATVQELVPPRVRGTVVAFFILIINLAGLCVGTTGGGYIADLLVERGVANPYTMMLFGFTVIAQLALPCYWLAGKRFEGDRQRLFAAEAEAAARATS